MGVSISTIKPIDIACTVKPAAHTFAITRLWLLPGKAKAFVAEKAINIRIKNNTYRGTFLANAKARLTAVVLLPTPYLEATANILTPGNKFNAQLNSVRNNFDINICRNITNFWQCPNCSNHFLRIASI